MQTYTHSFSVSENTDRTSREALIVFESENTGIKEDSGTKEVTFTLSNAESFRIDCVDGIRRIDLSAF